MAIDISSFVSSAISRGRIADPSLAGELPPEQWYQCVSLVKEYLRGFGLNPGHWGHAIDYWGRTHPDILTRFDRVQTSAAEQGDIVILLGLPGNPYGHIGISTGRLDPASVEILEQNGQTGGGTGMSGDRIRTRFVARGRVAGVLRPKAIANNNGGPEMVTKDSTNILRIGHSEIGGWDFGKTHRGDFDKIFHDAWDGHTVDEFVWTQWVNGAPYRDAKQQAFNAMAALASAPTQENYDKLKSAIDLCKVTEKELVEKNRQLISERQSDQDASDSLLRRLGQLIKRYLP